MNSNKHGLSRSIESSIKRQIRQRCGFGCVICGAGVYDYEHIDPEFTDATEHNPDKMALLCMQCHGKVSRGMWSKEKVKIAAKNPYCLQTGFAREGFDIGTQLPNIKFLGSVLHNCPTPIWLYDIPLFEIKPPEEIGAPYRLSGIFFNSRGQDTLEIVDNEWKANVDNWDVETVGASITIREAHGKVQLKLVAEPSNTLRIERLDMLYKGIAIDGNANSFEVSFQDGRRRRMTTCMAGSFPVAIAIQPQTNVVAGFII